MSMTETAAREAICRLGHSLFSRGLSFGSSGNISQRIDDGWLMTPTNVSLGDLDPARLSKLDNNLVHIGGDKPTKESFLHRVMYDGRPDAGAVVHLHSTHSVAVACMADGDPHACIGEGADGVEGTWELRRDRDLREGAVRGGEQRLDCRGDGQSQRARIVSALGVWAEEGALEVDAEEQRIVPDERRDGTDGGDELVDRRGDEGEDGTSCAVRSVRLQQPVDRLSAVGYRSAPSSVNVHVDEARGLEPAVGVVGRCVARWRGADTALDDVAAAE